MIIDIQEIDSITLNGRHQPHISEAYKTIQIGSDVRFNNFKYGIEVEKILQKNCVVYPGHNDKVHYRIYTLIGKENVNNGEKLKVDLFLDLIIEWTDENDFENPIVHETNIVIVAGPF